jgi:hypothetical protein
MMMCWIFLMFTGTLLGPAHNCGVADSAAEQVQAGQGRSGEATVLPYDTFLSRPLTQTLHFEEVMYDASLLDGYGRH